GVGALFNLPSLIANIFYARRRRWTVTWLNLVLIPQGLVAAATLWFGGMAFLRSWQEAGHYERLRRVDAAVRTNDSPARKRALDVCAADCTGFLDQFLLDATVDGAHRSMEYLLSRGANPASFRAFRAFRTCEGVDLGPLNSLAVSIARGDEVAIGLLLPGA